MIAPTAAAAAPRATSCATFCVEPPGLTPGRASIVTALLAGCIPVLFAPEQDRPLTGAAGGTRGASCSTCAGAAGLRRGRARAFRERRRRMRATIVNERARFRSRRVRGGARPVAARRRGRRLD